MASSIGSEGCPAKTYFLDTSTQISRHWAEGAVREQVRLDLSNGKLCCSTYVESQYRCRILNALVTLHILITNSSDLDEARARVEKCRDQGIVDSIIVATARRLFNRYNSRKPLLRYLSRMIEVDWENYFYDGVPKDLSDMTKCKRGMQTIQRKAAYYLPLPTCCPDDCGICDFWKTKTADLTQLAQMDASRLGKAEDPKETVTLIQDEAEAAISGKRPHGDACHVLSDAVISIEARDAYPEAEIHTMDRDFGLLKDTLKTRVRVFRVSAT